MIMDVQQLVPHGNTHRWETVVSTIHPSAELIASQLDLYAAPCRLRPHKSNNTTETEGGNGYDPGTDAAATDQRH